MTDKPADRHWQARCPDGEWRFVKGIQGPTILCADDFGVRWQAFGGVSLPSADLRLRYTVVVHGTWMAWKPGYMVMLAEDYDMPQLAGAIRAAQTQQRQERIAANG